MQFAILAAVVAAASAVPAAIYPGHAAYTTSIVSQPTIITKQAKTFYAPITQTNYGSQVNHLVAQPAPIAVPVAQPFAVPRAVPVAVPRAVPVPMIAQAAPIVTKSVAYASPAVYAGAYGHGYGINAAPAVYGNAYAGAYGHGYGYNAGYGYGKGMY